MNRRGKRLALPYEDWPAADRRAWERAQRPAPLFWDGLVRQLSAKTLAQMRKGYGLWLGWLAREGRLDESSRPGSRITIGNLRDYLADLQGRVSSQTVASRFNDLNATIRMIDPTADRTVLMRALRKLQKRARPVRDKRARMISPEALLKAGIRRMERVETEHHAKRDVQAGRYLDGLIMALLACRPIRRGTLVAMRLHQHLTRRDDRYVILFDESETKAGRDQEEELPPALTPYIDRYLDHYRPVLLRDHQSDAVWVSAYRGPISEERLYQRFCAATLEELGVALCPHLARDIAATGTVMERPDLAGVVPLVLDHVGSRTAAKHYVHARRIHASRVQGEDLLIQIAEALEEEEA